MPTTPPSLDPTSPLDLRDIPCRVKHAQILQRWLDLPVGGQFVFVNDHEPEPLHRQFRVAFPDAIAWQCGQLGPEEFHVRLSKLRSVPAPTSLPRPMAPCAG
jgi:uncharacterized protein (DUF2249 family)